MGLWPLRRSVRSFRRGWAGLPPPPEARSPRSAVEVDDGACCPAQTIALPLPRVDSEPSRLSWPSSQSALAVPGFVGWVAFTTQELGELFSSWIFRGCRRCVETPWGGPWEARCASASPPDFPTMSAGNHCGGTHSDWNVYNHVHHLIQAVPFCLSVAAGGCGSPAGRLTNRPGLLATGQIYLPLL